MQKLQQENYFWQADVWQKLQSYYHNNRIPHAVIINAAAGMAAQDMVSKFAQLLLCNATSENDPCGSCESCKLFTSDSNLDYIIIEPEEGSAVIKIDQIRALKEKLAQSSLAGGYRIVQINSAECMQDNAANALLKTLEEPSDRVIIMLLVESMANIPATIKSRCSFLTMATPSFASVSEWLRQYYPDKNDNNAELSYNLANGSPLHMLEIIEDNIAGKCLTSDIISHFCCPSIESTSAVLTRIKDYKAIEIVTLSYNLLYCALNYKYAAIEKKLILQDPRKFYELTDHASRDGLDKLYDYHCQLLTELATGIVWQLNTLFISLTNKWQELTYMQE